MGHQTQDKPKRDLSQTLVDFGGILAVPLLWVVLWGAVKGKVGLLLEGINNSLSWAQMHLGRGKGHGLSFRPGILRVDSAAGNRKSSHSSCSHRVVCFSLIFMKIKR